MSIGGGDDAAVIDIRGNQIDLAAILGGEAACVADVLCVSTGGVVMIAGMEICIAQVEGGGNQAGYVNGRTSSKQDAVGIDQKHASVGLQAAQDAAGVGAGDTI